MIRRALVLAVAAVSLLGATVAAAPAAVAAPGDPDQVALLVQKSPGSVQVRCVDFKKGMSGADVLTNAGASPVYGSGPYAGFVLQIDGFGNTRETPPSNTRYWAYWQGSSSGSYTYSGAGVSSTQPAAGSVEAWVWYDNGPVDFPQRSYASLCPNGFQSTPAPASPDPTPTGVAAPTGSGGGDTSAGAPAGSSGGGTSTPGGSATAHGSTSTSPGTTAPPTGPSASASAGGSAVAGGTSTSGTSVAASNVAATEATGGSGTGRTLGLIVAALVVVSFAALAIVLRRRRLDQE